jgi:orotate phosphoribosyltransferase
LAVARNGVGELKAYIEKSLYQKEKGYFEYDEWKIFNDPKLLLLATECLAQRIVDSKLEFDLFGALGGSGTPLATSLMLEFQKRGFMKQFLHISDPLVGLSSLWLRILKPEGAKGRILLVDTEVKSGRTVLDGYRKVSNKVGPVTGIAMLTDYVGFPDRKDYQEIVFEKQVPVIKLFDYHPLEPRLEESQ